MIKLQHDIPVKIQQSKQQRRICFNPICTLPFQRVFSINHEHNQLINCANWITNINQNSQNKLENAFQDQLILDLGKNSMIQSLQKINILANRNSKHFLNVRKQAIISEFVAQIYNIFNSIQKSIQSIKSEEFYRAITKLSQMPNQNILQQEIQTIIELYIRPLSQKKIRLGFQSASLQIPSHVIQLFSQKYYQQQKHTDFEYTLLDLCQNKKFEKFMQQGPSFNKLQQICSLAELPQIKYKYIKDRCYLECPFCSQNVQTYFIKSKRSKKEQPNSTIKMIKKILANKILKHLMDFHYEPIYESYANKYVDTSIKDQKQEISYKSMLNLIKRVNRIFVIDRQSGIKVDKYTIKNLTKKYQKQSIFIFEVLSRGNIKMAKIKYILTNDRSSTEFLITYLVLDICHNRKMIHPQNINILSNSWKFERYFNLESIFMNESEDDKNTHIQAQKDKKDRKIGKSDPKRQNLNYIKQQFSHNEVFTEKTLINHQPFQPSQYNNSQLINQKCSNI